MAIINKKGYLRVLSRHPSHKAIRNVIKLPTRERIGFRLGSVTPTNHFSFNSIEGVENSKDKLKMKRLFAKAGVQSPEFWEFGVNGGANGETFEELGQNLPYPVLAKRVYRSKGKGMLKIDNYEEYIKFINEKVRNNNYQKKNPYYMEKFYNFSREYRLHISELGCFYACRKMLKENAEKRWMRNDSNSVWITERNLTKHDPNNVSLETITYEGENETFNKPGTWDNLIKDCQKARKALGLDTCCFDVKMNKKGQWMILESNSAPSFGQITSIFYIEELKKLINKKNNV